MTHRMAEDELWATLRLILARVDPVPAAVRDAARASLAWRDPDAALARLVADSAMEAPPVGVRGGGSPRLLTFAGAGLTIEIEANRADRFVQLVGQLVPAVPARLRIDHRTGRLELAADDYGRFAADEVVPGPVRLTCTVAGAAPVNTSWVLL